MQVALIFAAILFVAQATPQFFYPNGRYGRRSAPTGNDDHEDAAAANSLEVGIDGVGNPLGCIYTGVGMLYECRRSFK